MKKFGILLIFSLIPFVGLNSVQTVLADHGGNVEDCGQVGGGPYWDPNTNMCVDQCPAGLSFQSSLIADVTNGMPHCLLIPSTIGGELINLESTSLLLASTYSTAAWMIPVLVSAIGIAIVIARKF